jgi:hypothetical protein
MCVYKYIYIGHILTKNVEGIHAVMNVSRDSDTDEQALQQDIDNLQQHEEVKKGKKKKTSFVSQTQTNKSFRM